MEFLPEGTISGYYPATKDPDLSADVRAAFEFSHRPDGQVPGRPNIETAQRLEQAHKILPLDVFASRSIDAALKYLKSDIKVTEVFDGPSASGIKENTGTWGELNQLRELMNHYGFERPEMYTSGFNIGNIVRQARMLGLDPIVPGDLPRSFDPESDQLWTSSRLWWSALAIPRIYKLKRSGH